MYLEFPYERKALDEAIALARSLSVRPVYFERELGQIEKEAQKLRGVPQGAQWRVRSILDSVRRFRSIEDRLALPGAWKPIIDMMERRNSRSETFVCSTWYFDMLRGVYVRAVRSKKGLALHDYDPSRPPAPRDALGFEVAPRFGWITPEGELEPTDQYSILIAYGMFRWLDEELENEAREKDRAEA